MHCLNTTKGSTRSEAEFLRDESLPGAMAPEGGTAEQEEREYIEYIPLNHTRN